MFRIDGAGFSYTFPTVFHLESYERKREVETALVGSVDGEAAIPETSVANLVHVLAGFQRGGSIASTLNRFDEMMEAVTQSDSVYLIDTEASRRVPVRAVSVKANRAPARQIPVEVEFETRETPYWEGLNASRVNLGTKNWIDVPLGDAPSWGDVIIKGFHASPTIVRGVWNFCSHIGIARATAINSRAGGQAPLGTVNGVGGGTLSVTKHGIGRLLGGETLAFSSLICRTDKFSFCVRFEPSTAWSTSADITLFDFNDGNSTLGTHHYHLKIAGGTPVKYEFGFSGATIRGAVTAYAAGKAIQVLGWVDTAGTVIDGQTVKARLFEGETQIASRATFSQPSTNTLTKLFVGSPRNATQPPRVIIDEIYLWHQNVGDGYLQGVAAEQRQLSPDNTTVKWAATLPTTDYLAIKNWEGEIVQYSNSGVADKSRMRPFTGKFSAFGGGRSHSKAGADTLFSRQALRGEVRYRKRYF